MDYPPEECFMTASVECGVRTGAWPSGSPLPDGMGVMMYPGVSPDYFRFDMPPEGAEISLKGNTYLGNIVQQMRLFRHIVPGRRRLRSFQGCDSLGTTSDGRAEIATGLRLPASGSEPRVPRRGTEAGAPRTRHAVRRRTRGIHSPSPCRLTAPSL